MEWETRKENPPLNGRLDYSLADRVGDEQSGSRPKRLEVEFVPKNARQEAGQ